MISNIKPYKPTSYNNMGNLNVNLHEKPVPELISESNYNISMLASQNENIDSEAFVANDEYIKEELEKMGVDIEGIDSFEQIDDEHIEITFSNGEICKFKICDDGSLMVLSGVGYDSNGNVVFKGELDPETNEGYVLYYDVETGNVIQEVHYNSSHKITLDVVYNTDGEKQSSTEYIYFDQGSYKTTTIEEGKTTSITYNENNIPIYGSITYDDKSKITYNFTADGSVSAINYYSVGGRNIASYYLNSDGLLKSYILYDENGKIKVKLSDDNTYQEVDDSLYYIDSNGRLAVIPISDLGSVPNDNTIRFIAIEIDGQKMAALFNSDGSITYVDKATAKDMGITLGYDFKERTSLSYDGYYYPTSPNDINQTNSIGSCVWYVVGRINEVYDEVGIEEDWSYHGYGAEWASGANSPYGGSKDVTEVRAGAVASYYPNHVVYIESVNSDGTVNISEANVGTNNEAGFRYTEGVSLSELENLYGSSFQGYVYTLPEE